MGRPLKKGFLHLISVTANVDSTSVTGENIIKQVRTSGYKVDNGVHGVGICNLVANSAPNPGEMFTLAQDSDNNTYYIVKLTRHKATLVQKELVGSAFQFANGPTGDEAVKHNFGSPAVEGQSVSLVGFD